MSDDTLEARARRAADIAAHDFHQSMAELYGSPPDEDGPHADLFRELADALAAAQKAIRPFAWFGDTLRDRFCMIRGPEDMEPDDHEDSKVISAGNEGLHCTLRLRHFDEARALLAKLDGHSIAAGILAKLERKS